eukprot:NODE_3514_length_776_cov_203.006935.p2 GENE.NODE_3514_length_776_cov_203.006935~~NODE_3514_length_776_cov_203.006935.p2  ORF type:complete len:141 (-),score=44.00 NODE_3514_length_776_cov_203.006935:131-553(-)
MLLFDDGGYAPHNAVAMGFWLVIGGTALTLMIVLRILRVADGPPPEPGVAAPPVISGSIIGQPIAVVGTPYVPAAVQSPQPAILGGDGGAADAAAQQPAVVVVAATGTAAAATPPPGSLAAAEDNNEAKSDDGAPESNVV